MLSFLSIAQLSLVFTSDASTSTSTSANTIILHRENGVDAGISTSASTSTRIKIFLFLVLTLMLAFALQQVKTTEIFTTRGYVWPMKTLDPDYLAPKQFGRLG